MSGLDTGTVITCKEKLLIQFPLYNSNPASQEVQVKASIQVLHCKAQVLHLDID
jgi:hypothetical protein